MNNKKGFTLIELSIVLLILFLITGGIILGSKLIDNAKLYSLNKKFEYYKTAKVNFQLQFNYLPGDFNKAKVYWGDSAVNGNGNNLFHGHQNPREWATNELFAFWQHLSLSGTIDESYSGVSHNSQPYYMLPGTNIPKFSKLGEKAGISFSYVSEFSPWVASTGAHYFAIGREVQNDTARDSVLTIKQALKFDQKFDDGAPDSGNVISALPGDPLSGECIISDGNGAYKYNLASDTAVAKCKIFYNADS